MDRRTHLYQKKREREKEIKVKLEKAPVTEQNGEFRIPTFTSAPIE